MSATVDNKIVQMTFDNKEFERNAQQSMSTLDKLKNALKFEKSTDGLKDVANVANHTSLSGLENGILKVQNQFSALQAVAFTVLQDITRSALNAGKNIANALTIEPVTTGFQEYETQMNAIQTILSNTKSKGSTLEDVNNALDTLNTYADKTIYNFTEMTKNIGTFTAAGVDLQTATNSIQGIANLAAISGSSSQQASTAMYQLSQALAAGTVKLQDWNSVVNAGMGGEVFQNALKRTATVMGTNVDDMIKKYGSFRESLTKGEWLTTEVLTETLNQFANVYSKKELIQKGYTESQAKEILALGQDAEDAATKVKTVTQLFDTLKEAAQSGWTQSWEILVGDFMEARTLLTDISNSIGGIIDAQSKARNDLLEQAFGEHSVKSKEWADTMGKLYKDAYADTIDEQKMFISTSKLYGKDMEKMIFETDAYAKALKKGTISEKDSLDTVLKKTGAFKEVMDKGVVDKNMLEGVWKFNQGVGHMAKNSKEATKYQHQLRDKINEVLKSGKSGGEMLDILWNKKLVPQHEVFANLAGKLKNAGTSYAEFTEKTKKLKGYSEEETKQLWELKKALEASDDPMVKLMREMERPTGRTNIIEGFRNVLTGLASVIKAVGKAWSSVFPKLDATGVYNATVKFREFTEGLKVSKKASNEITQAFIPIFKTLKAGLSVVGAGVRVFGSFLKVVVTIAKELLIFVGGVIEFVESVAKSSEVTSAWGKFIDAIKNALDIGLKSLKDFTNNIKGFVDSVKSLPGMTKFADSLKEIAKSVASFTFNNFSKFIDMAGEFFGGLSSYLPSLDDILGALDKLSTSAANFISSLTGKSSSKGEDVSKMLEKTGIKKVADEADGIQKKLAKSGDKFKGAKDTFVKAIKKFGEDIKNLASDFDFERLQDILKVGALVVMFVLVVRLFNAITRVFKGGEKITKKVGTVLDSLSGTLKAYQMQIKADAIMTVAKAIAILAGAIVVLCFIPTDALAAVTVDLIALLLAIALVIKVLGKIGSGAGPVAEGADGIKGALTNLVDGIKDTLTKSAKIAAFGAFAIMLGIAIGLVVKAISDLCKVPFGKGMVAMYGVTAIALMLVGMGKLINDHAKDLNAGMGVGLLGMAAAILLLSKAASVFAAMDTDSLIKGLGSVVTLMAMTALIAKASQGSSMISLAVGMLILAAAFTALIPPILIFSMIPWDTFGKGALMLGILGVSLAIIATISQGTMSGALAIAVLAGSLMLLTPILLALGVAAPVAILGIINLGLALAVLTAAGAIAGIGLVAAGLATLATTLPMVGVGLLAAGAGAMLFGVGIGVAAMGLTVFGKALPAIAQGIVVFSQLIASNAPVIIAAIGVICLGIAAAILASSGALGAAAVAVLIGVLAALVTNFPQVMSTLGNLLSQLWSWLSTTIPSLFMKLVDFIIRGIDAIAKGISANAGAIYHAIGNIMAAMGNLIIEGLAQIVEKFPVFGAQMASALRDAKTDIKDSLPPEEGKESVKGYTDGAAQGATEGMTNITDAFKNGTTGIAGAWDGLTLDNTKMTQFSTDNLGALDTFKTGVDGNMTDVTNIFKDGATDISGSWDNLNLDSTKMTQFSTDNLGALDNFKTGTDTKVKDINKSLSNIGNVKTDNPAKKLTKSFSNIDMTPVTGAKDKIVKTFSNLPDTLGKKGKSSANAISKSFKKIDAPGIKSFKKSVTSNMESAAKTVSSKSKAIKKSMQDSTKVKLDAGPFKRGIEKIAKAADGQKKKFGKAGKESGKTYTRELSSGVSEGVSRVKDKVGDAAASAANAFSNKRSSFYNAGSYTTGGLVNGIYSKFDSIRSAAAAAAEAFNSTYKSKLQIKSPSRVTFKSGVFTMTGLINGLKSMIRGVKRSAGDTADAFMERLNTPLTDILSLFDSDMSLSPVITPVIDDSLVSKGINGINGMFGNRTLSLGGLNPYGMSFAASSVQNRNSNYDVVNAISKLRKDISNIQSNVTNINGITYDDGSNVTSAVETLVRASRMGARA